MANRLQKTPIAVYTPAVTPIPERPAYCVTERVFASYQNASVPPSDPAPGTGVSWPVFVLRPVYRTVTTCYPRIVGRPGSPARTDYYSNAGWNAGARSISTVPENGFFRCVLPSTLSGVQIGFTDAAFDHTYAHMSHALVARATGYTIIEAGHDVTAEAPLPAGAEVEIRRTGGVVTFLINGSLVYTSETPSAGEVFAGAVLYSTLDYVDSPVIGSLDLGLRFDATLPRIETLLSDTDVVLFDRPIPRLALAAILDAVPGVMRLQAELPAVRALMSDRDVVLFDAELPVPRVSAHLARPEAVVSGMVGLLPPPVFSSLLRSGEAMSFSAELPSRVHFLAADRPVVLCDAELDLRLRLMAWEPYMPEGEIDGGDAAYMVDQHTLEFAMLLVGMDSLGVESTTASLLIVMELAAMDGLQMLDNASIGSIVELLAMEQVAINSTTSAARRQALQYAVNYMTGALARYQDFDFLGFTQNAHGDAYAWRSDGLYRLGTERDEGDVIRALVDFGATDYGDAHLKRLDAAYLGVRTDGQCYLRVTGDDGVERVYQLVGEGSQKRGRLAKGVASRYWNVRLEVADASFATIDNIELEVAVSQRRGYGSRT